MGKRQDLTRKKDTDNIFQHGDIPEEIVVVIHSIIAGKMKNNNKKSLKPD